MIFLHYDLILHLNGVTRKTEESIHKTVCQGAVPKYGGNVTSAVTNGKQQ